MSNLFQGRSSNQQTTDNPRFLDFLNNDYTQIGTNLAGSLLKFSPRIASQSNTTQTLNTTYNQTSDALMQSGNPYAMMIGGGMKLGALASDGLTAAGLGTDQVTGLDKVLDSHWFKLTPAGFVNAIGAKRTNSFAVNQDVQNHLSSSYNLDDLNKASNLADKKVGAFNFGKVRQYNDFIAQARKKQRILTNINDNEQDAIVNQNWEGTGLRNEMSLNGDYQSLRIGRNGLKMEAVNVIPDGALHKNKHHLEEVGVDTTELTNKGIPVVTEQNGELKQQAEIEVNEIILHLELTEKLEDNLKKLKEAKDQEEKDKIAIETGKLLTEELLNNTIDNTGLTKTC